MVVNGREFLIKPDREVVVPVGVLHVLQLANMQVAKTSGGASQGITSFHSAPHFALTVLGAASES